MCVAVLGVSCLSRKEVQGEIPEEIAQLAVVSGPCWEQLLGAVVVGKWLLQEPVRPCSAIQKEPCMSTGYSGSGSPKSSGACAIGVNCGGCG